MKYKIVKKTTKYFSADKINGQPDIKVTYSTWYIAKRKGRLFGFWHSLGNRTDYYGDLIVYCANTIEEMEKYIQKWHEWKYDNTLECEIVKEITI